MLTISKAFKLYQSNHGGDIVRYKGEVVLNGERSTDYHKEKCPFYSKSMISNSMPGSPIRHLINRSITKIPGG